jgi:hypothetical protein
MNLNEQYWLNRQEKWQTLAEVLQDLVHQQAVLVQQQAQLIERTDATEANKRGIVESQGKLLLRQHEAELDSQAIRNETAQAHASTVDLQKRIEEAIVKIDTITKVMRHIINHPTQLP